MAYDLTTNRLDLLTAREQLMHDIDCICDEFFYMHSIPPDPELVTVLCDAVVANFPIN